MCFGEDTGADWEVVPPFSKATSCLILFLIESPGAAVFSGMGTATQGTTGWLWWRSIPVGLVLVAMTVVPSGKAPGRHDTLQSSSDPQLGDLHREAMSRATSQWHLPRSLG